MKSLKIWSMAVMMLLAMVACKPKPGPDGPAGGNLELIEKEWKLSTVNGVEADFNIYVSFNDGAFAMYQQLYTLDFRFFEGEYSINGSTLSGSYFDGGDWRCDYTAAIDAEGKTLTLKCKESTPVTSVYVACEIPEEVKEEATATRSAEVVPYL